MAESLEKAKKSGYWIKVDQGFQVILISSIRYYETIISDLIQIKGTIEEDRITEREVQLLRRIGDKAVEYNADYGLLYHGDHLWQDYEDPDFKVVDDMYGEGRAFFVSLQDANNASYRLEDYMRTEKTSDNSTHVTFQGEVSNSQIQIGTENSTQNAEGDQIFPYDDVLRILLEISKYKDNLKTDLGTNGEEFTKKLYSVIEQTKEKEKPSIIKRGLSALRDFVIGVSGSLAASGVLSLINQLPMN